MKEVSCRAFDIFFQDLRRRKLDPAFMAEGVNYSVEHLQNKHEWIEWDQFVAVHVNIAKHWSGDERVALATRFLHAPLVRTLYIPARLLFSLKSLYQWALGDQGGGGKQLFRCAHNEYRFVPPNQAVLELTLPPGYPPCRDFFLMSRAVFSDMPSMLGYEAAAVDMTELSNGARYEITFPEETGLMPKIRRAITWPFTVRAAARELKDAHEELLNRYKELEDYRSNLEIKVEERTAEIARARDDLERTLQTLRDAQALRSRLFANINHEVRHPLAQMLALVERIGRREAALDAASREELGGIDNAARRLLRLVDGLLLLAAGQEDRLRLRVEVIDVVAPLRRTIAAWRPMAEAHGIDFHFDAPEQLECAVDVAAIDRIVTNLVSNSFKFTPEGGRVDVRVAPLGDEFELSVRDTGPGIDDEFRARIFGRFEQGHGLQHAEGGSGIGLSIVKELAEGHGGHVELASAPGEKGAHFRVVLPVKASAEALRRIALTDVPGEKPVAEVAPLRLLPSDYGLSAPLPAALDPIVGPSSPLATILVAEDDPGLRRLIVESLCDLYRVIPARDGREALLLAVEHHPELLLSDVGMPEMDGLELTREFRALPGNRLAPVLLLTAYSSLEDRLRGFASGALDYMVKPFATEELRARVRSQLAIRDLALRLHESETRVSLGVLSSGLAHELRNPANGIVNALSPLRELLPAELLTDDSSTGQLFQVLEDCSAQLATVCRQLLGLRSSGELVRVAEPFSRILSRAIAIVTPALDGLRLENACDYIGPVWCSGALVAQVLANLVENGAHAAGRGGWVRITSRVESERLVVEIADSGPGVRPDLREKIFDPFFTTKPPGKGTGLGLTTSREIAARHGGLLDVRTSVDATTLFHLEIPLGPPAGEALDDQAAASRSPLRRAQ